MDLTVKIEGLDKIGRASEKVRENVTRELRAGLFVSGKKIEKDAKESILNGEKTGIVYKRRTVVHRASAPGEAPASDTGRLVNSIATEVASGLEVLVKAGGGIVKYARMLEFGTSKMAARPFFHPAAEKNRRWIVERLKEAVRRGLSRGRS